jgi:hypothetical protein
MERLRQARYRLNPSSWLMGRFDQRMGTQTAGARNGARIGRDADRSHAHPIHRACFWKTGVAPEAAVPVIGLNGVFIVLLPISALLFRRAARTHEMPLMRLE